jgi:hypothetical protein
MDAVWLMGVWERSPSGLAIALRNQALQEEIRRVLPDARGKDVVGSPYCVRRYETDAALGGRDGLAETAWQLDDLLSGARYRNSGSGLERKGLFVDLAPWGFHLLTASPVAAFEEVKAEAVS